MVKLKRGEVVFLTPENSSVWIAKTRDELDAERQRDIDRGVFMDSAGEPIMYGPYMGYPDGTPVMTVQVTSLWADWNHWRRKPKYLRTGWWVEGQRIILFTM